VARASSAAMMAPSYTATKLLGEPPAMHSASSAASADTCPCSCAWRYLGIASQRKMPRIQLQLHHPLYCGSGAAAAAQLLFSACMENIKAQLQRVRNTKHYVCPTQAGRTRRVDRLAS